MSSGKQKPTIERIEPIITASEAPTFQPKPGEYHLVRLDPNGNEVPGSDFSIGENTFRRTYEPLTKGDKPTYLKKNTNP